jgi:hypothetical protein
MMIIKHQGIRERDQGENFSDKKALLFFWKRVKRFFD